MLSSEKIITLHFTQGAYTKLIKTLDTHRQGLSVVKEMNPIWKDNLLNHITTVESIIKTSKKE